MLVYMLIHIHLHFHTHAITRTHCRAISALEKCRQATCYPGYHGESQRNTVTKSDTTSGTNSFASACTAAERSCAASAPIFATGPSASLCRSAAVDDPPTSPASADTSADASADAKANCRSSTGVTTTTTTTTAACTASSGGAGRVYVCMPKRVAEKLAKYRAEHEAISRAEEFTSLF